MVAAGQKLRVSDFTTGGSGGGNPVVSSPTAGFVAMTADKSVTSSTTLVDATGLAFSVAASARYVFTGWLVYTAAAAGDLKIRPSVPAGASGYWSLLSAAWDQTPVASTEWTNYGKYVAETLGNSLHAAGSTDGTTPLIAKLEGAFTTDTTAGAFQVQCAQKASSGTATVLRAGSFLQLARIS